MIDPKIFYREFDHLLREIRQKKNDKNFLVSILCEVQKHFSDMLSFGPLHLYEDRGEEFRLIHTCELQPNGYSAAETIPANAKAVRLLEEHGSYIYDENSLSIDPAMSTRMHYAIPAAIILRGPERRWIVIFELESGWVREEVLFSLNAIRSAINYRLFSDAVTTDMEQAAQIQRSLLPGGVPEISGYDIAARSQPTEIVGGDLYDFYVFDDDIFGLCVGDASGHGLPAALLVRDVVIGLRMGLEKQMKMVFTLEKLNKVIYRSTYSSRFVSLFYGEVEKDGHLIFANAGHPAPFVIHGKTVIDLKATGLILGAIPEITLHRSYAQLPPGSVLVLYSDGLFERENANEQSYNIDRLKKLVMAHQDKSAAEIVDIVFKEVDKFGNYTKWEDDSTLVVIKRADD